MVHYNPEWHAAQLPPPICPKCGGHRTQIVGRSDDGKTVTVRCNACGERSRVDISGLDQSSSASGADASDPGFAHLLKSNSRG